MKTAFPWNTPFSDSSAFIGDNWWINMNKRFYNIMLSLGADLSLAEKASDKIRKIIKRYDNYNLYPDSLEVLTEAKRRGYINIMLSNNYPDIDDVLENLNLLDKFSEIIISGRVGCDKPDPKIFEIAKLCCKSFDECYMIGDNPVADIEGGNSAGFKTVLVHNRCYSDADYAVDNLCDILDIID